VTKGILFGASVSIVAAVLSAVGASTVYADESEHESESVHEADHEFHRNFVAGFVGITSEARREKAVALGIAYERFLNESFAIGIIAEHSFGDLNFWVYAVPFAYRTGRWRLYVAPGVEDGDHGTESLVRLGAEYAFEVGTLEISPQLAVDFVDGEEVFVLGVVIGKAF
jgi:hypothetical protein